VVGRAELNVGDAERDDRRLMAMDHRLDHRQRLVDLAVDVALNIGSAAIATQCLTILAKMHDVGGGDQTRCHAAGQEKDTGFAVVALTWPKPSTTPSFDKTRLAATRSSISAGLTGPGFVLANFGPPGGMINRAVGEPQVDANSRRCWTAAGRCTALEVRSSSDRPLMAIVWT
jgi:hypothetical protein